MDHDPIPSSSPGLLLSLEDVAKRLGIHPKTLRRLLPGLMEREPRLFARKVGRSLKFTEADYELLLETTVWRPPQPIIRDRGRTVRIRGKAGQEQTAQERVRERLSAELDDRKRQRAAQRRW